MQADARRLGPKLERLIVDYLASGAVAPTDVATLELLKTEVGALRVNDVTARWADAWVRDMKLLQHLAPGTIRKRVGSLARVMDAHIRAQLKEGEAAPANPLRMMPRAYSQYTEAEVHALRFIRSRKRRVQSG